MTLRLAWLGPWNGDSAIATFGRFIVDELAARGHEVTICRSEVGAELDKPPLSAPGPVLTPAALPTQTLARQFDGVIANIGNHYPYHGGLIPLLEQVPCLQIFHDGFLAHLAQGWAYNHFPSGERRLRTLVDCLYGAGTWPTEHAYLQDLEKAATHWPMTEWLAAMAAGIITHSHRWVPRLRAATSGRVDVLPLAYPGADFPPPRPLGQRLVIATIGHVNSNKRCDEVIRAIASDPLLRERCEYRLLGQAWPQERDRLEALAAELGVPPPRFSGWLSDEEMRAAMAEVDIVACLRHPVLEAGSASLIVAMRSGRPVLVSNQGVYAEIPPNLVLPCTPGAEAADVAVWLRSILANPRAATTIGQLSRNYPEKFFSAAHYVDGLLPAVEAATRTAPAVQMARHLGTIAGAWGISPDSPTVTRLSRIINGLFQS